MTTFLWAMLLVTCAALMWALAAFDRLIDIGNSAGRPIGGREVGKEGVIRPAKRSSLQKGLARNRLFVTWLFRPPKWAGEIRTARSLIRRLRVSFVIAVMGFFSFGVGAFLHI